MAACAGRSDFRAGGMLLDSIDHAEAATVADPGILRALGWPNSGGTNAGELWHHLLIEKQLMPQQPRYRQALANILQHGTLARRLVSVCGSDPAPSPNASCLPGIGGLSDRQSAVSCVRRKPLPARSTAPARVRACRCRESPAVTLSGTASESGPRWAIDNENDNDIRRPCSLLVVSRTGMDRIRFSRHNHSTTLIPRRARQFVIDDGRMRNVTAKQPQTLRPIRCMTDVESVVLEEQAVILEESPLGFSH